MVRINKKEILEHYSQESVVSNYLLRRFCDPVGIAKHQKQVHFINNVISNQNLRKVLEIACGPARLTKHINLLDQGYAIDSSEAMLRLAAIRFGLDCKWKLLRDDAFNLKFNKNSFDLVFTVRFIRHFKEEDRKKIYAEIRRVLRPQGYFILDALNKKVNKQVEIIKKLKGTHKVYDIAYSKEDIIAELEANGFEVLKTEPIIMHFFVEYIISKFGYYLGIGKYLQRLIEMLEKVNGNCWEWIVLCRQKI